MKTILIKSESRGSGNYGWLEARYTFSFANYYDPSRIHFGMLRVLNDDIVEPSQGFETHPHDNMEIITIPLKGTLSHRDSMGHTKTLAVGEVQVMSAGTGIHHSEFNASNSEPLNMLQIWIFPDTKEVEPRYKQRQLNFLEDRNQLHNIVMPYEGDKGLWIHQNAWLSMGTFDKGVSETYLLNDSRNGVYTMVIEGMFRVAGVELGRRDGLGISEIGSFTIESLTDDAKILLIEVPMFQY